MPGFGALNDPFEGSVLPDFRASFEAKERFWRARYHEANADSGEDFEDVLRRHLGQIDEATLEQRHADTTKRIVNATGVLCFAGRPDSVPMWSYYAAEHTGVCLRFRMDDTFLKWAFDGTVFGKVHYAREYPRVRFYEAPHPEWIRALLFTKGSDWAHEDEWRIIRDRGIGPRVFPAECLDGVILGARMPSSDREQVRAIVRRRGVETELLEARVEAQAFVLSIVSETPKAVS